MIQNLLSHGPLRFLFAFAQITNSPPSVLHVKLAYVLNNHKRRKRQKCSTPFPVIKGTRALRLVELSWRVLFLMFRSHFCCEVIKIGDMLLYGLWPFDVGTRSSFKKKKKMYYASLRFYFWAIFRHKKDMKLLTRPKNGQH